MKKRIGWLLRIAGAAGAGVCVAMMLESGTAAGSIIEALLYYGILILAYRYGAGTGAVAGTVCGIIFAVIKNDVAALGILCLVGTLAGVFKRLGKAASAVGFITGAVGAGIIYAPTALKELIMGLILSVFAFMLTPAGFCEGVLPSGRKAQKKDFSGKDKVFTEKLQSMSRTMGDVVRYIGCAGRGTVITPAVTAAVMCTISNVICDNCSECVMGCADNKFDSTVLNNISRLYEDHGRVTETDIENFFNTKCVNKDIYVNELNAGLGSVIERKEWEHHYSESRNTVASGYKEMEGFLEKMADDLGRINDFTPDVADDIINGVGRKMIVKELLAIEGAYGKEIYMTVAAKGQKCETARGIASRVSNALDINLMPAEECPLIIGRKPVRLKLIEDTEYMVLFGVARERKAGENVSGDSFSQMNLIGQKIFLGLSDGMGSGKTAAEHSKTAIGMAEKLLENGFSAEQVSRTVNSVLLMQEDEQPTTVDMCVADMKNADMKIVKLGAPPTFIKREGSVEILNAPSLPAGVVSDFGGQVMETKLKDGDIIIMMTDGVLDSIQEDDKEKVMRDIILDIDSSNPKEISNIILSAVRPETGAIDDMTVISAGIWKR